MFWGLIMEPNKRYTQVVDKAFHISQAAMDTSTGDNDPCQVMVVVDVKNFLVCTLQKNKNIQVPLDLYFKTGDSISFLTNGKCNVHLTGYLDPDYEEDEEEGEEEEEEEEEETVPALVPTKNKRKLDNSSETSASKKPKQDKKAAKKAAVEESSDSDEDEDQLQKFLDGEEIDTDENDDSFKVNTSGEADSDEDSDDEEEVEGGAEEDAEQESSEEAETTLDTSKEDSKQDMSKLSKNQKRRLKKKLAQQAKEQPKVNGVDKAKKEKPEPKAEKKKAEAKKAEPQEAPAEKKEKKALTGGVSIEDTKVGSGPAAKPGKVVMVYYEGRLKSNNKMFDNCLKGPGFKFRLGAKEVITGWDVGINGMKVGGKRKIVCPPAMAYGAKGSPPVIPPNSTLVFDVELKQVK